MTKAFKHICVLQWSNGNYCQYTIDGDRGVKALVIISIFMFYWITVSQLCIKFVFVYKYFYMLH